MKTQAFKLAIILSILLLSCIIGKAEPVKKIHKSWPLSKVSELSVENKFGNILFVDTRTDSVTIDITIDTDKGRQESKQLVELIDFRFDMQEGKVIAKTVFSEKFSSKQNFSINYVINLPSNKAIEVSNKYGNVNLDELKAKGKFQISYGNLMATTLQAPSNEKIKLELKYGNATIEQTNRFLGQISYSNLQVTKMNYGEMDTRYSSISAETINEMVATSKYDNYNIVNIDKLKADSKFTDWKIEKATSSAEIITEYGDVKIKNVPEGFQKITILNQYGNIRIGISEKASYHLKGETNYCEIKYPKTKADKFIKDNHHTIIEAYIGSRNTSSVVNVESKYGKVDLME